MWARIKYVIFPCSLLAMALSTNFRQADFQLEESTSVSIVQHHAAPPLITATPLSDSLSEEVIAALDLTQVNGVKYKYYDGLYSSYFEYKADKQMLINALSMLAFKLVDLPADTTCHPIQFELLQELAATTSVFEVRHERFWSLPEKEFDAYECVKPPFVHTVLISKQNRDVFHRVHVIA